MVSPHIIWVGSKYENGGHSYSMCDVDTVSIHFHECYH